MPARPLDIQGGTATVTANNFALGSVGATALSEGGFHPRVVFNDNVVSASGRRTSPLVEVRQGDLVALGNLLPPLEAGTAGTFIHLGDPRSDTRIADNIAAGWTIAKP